MYICEDCGKKITGQFSFTVGNKMNLCAECAKRERDLRNKTGI